MTAYSSDTESSSTNTGFAYALANFYTFVASGFFTSLGKSTAQFTNGSSNATQWDWDFGDGITTTAQNPGDHIYSSSTSAKYTISLTVNNILNIPDIYTQYLFLNSPPSSLNAATTTANQVNLTWQDNSLYADGYELYRQINNGAFSLYTTLPPHTSNFMDSDVVNNMDYGYQARSTTNQAFSDFTNVATAHTSTSVGDWAQYVRNHYNGQTMMEQPALKSEFEYKKYLKQTQK